MIQTVNPDFKHLIEKEIVLKDSILIFKKIVNHFAGHLHHHVETAKIVLDPTNLVQEHSALSKLREKLNNFEIAQKAKTTATYKMGTLKSIMRDELLKCLTMLDSADLILKEH